MKNTAKKLFCALLAAVLLIGLVPGLAGTVSASSVVGDANGDGKVNNKDVVTLFRLVSEADETMDKTVCDCNGDGKINNKDVVTLFNYVSGKITELYHGGDEPDRPDLDNVYKVWDDSVANTFKNANQTEISVTNKGALLTFRKTAAATDPYVVFDIAEYARIKNKPSLPGKNGSYVMLRVESDADGFTELFTHSPKAGDSNYTRYIADGTDRFMLVAMTNTTLVKPTTLTTVRIDWAGGNAEDGASMLIKEIGFFTTKKSALEYIGMTETEVKGTNVEELVFDSYNDVPDFIRSDNAAISSEYDSGDDIVAIRSNAASPSITVDINRIANQRNQYVRKARYVAVGLKVSGAESVGATLSNAFDLSGIERTLSKSDSTDKDLTGWQGVIFDINDVTFGVTELNRLVISFSGFTSDTVVKIRAIAVTSDLSAAVKICNNSKYAGTKSGIVRDGTPKKYFTISFDDGITQDLHTIEILKKYNFTKATFFINTGLYGANWAWVGETLGNTNVTHIRFTKAQMQTGIYSAYDVESHTLNHPSMKNYDSSPATIKRELMNDAENIYELTGIYPTGFAWPGGDTEYTSTTVKLVMENTTMRFARGTTSSYNFKLPTEFLKWKPTCAVNEANSLTLLQQFLNAECKEDMVFYTWAHGYEFDYYNSWSKLDQMIKMVTEADDVILVTNSEFYQLFKNQIPSVK
ncbi:MAG: polysaccharide deacetylase family protein [Clostridia bacterium]|nr:polysaccharide deacetylase family protein [Clostridia bacterium]